MKPYKFVFGTLVFFLFVALKAQSLFVDHTIKAGETLYSISKKYRIAIQSIERANPKIENHSLKIGTTIKIPKINNLETIEKNLIHQVEPKETLYGLGRKYGVSVGAIIAVNGGLTEGLKIGSKLLIPLNPIDAPGQKKPLNKGIKTHIVLQKGETFVRIAKIHGVTIESVKALNPYKSEPFAVGAKLRIDTFYRLGPAVKENVTPKKFKTHIVRPNQTLFSIIQKEKVEFSELLKYNPELAFGLKAGMELLIPELKIVTEIFGKRWISFQDKQPIRQGIGPNNKIDIVLMAPFYLKENKEDEILPKSKFATEFYLGATYALEVLRKKGMSVTMQVLDTERDSAKVLSLLKENDFSNTDLIIGPFYKGLSELVADRIKNIPIASPLSKTVNLTNRENLIQYIPEDAYVHKKVLDLILDEKQENELVILKDSAQNTRFILEYMQEHFVNPKVYKGYIPDSLAGTYDGKNVQFLFASKNRKEIHKTLIKLKNLNNYRGFRVYNLFDNMSYRGLSDDYIKALKFVIPKTVNSTKKKPFL